MNTDMINGLFEMGGALVTLLSVRQILRDRCLLGAHWGPTIFFTVWGCYNIFFYPSLHLPFSTVGAGLLVGVNVMYLGFMLQFRHTNPRVSDYLITWHPGHMDSVTGQRIERQIRDAARRGALPRG